MPTGGVSEPTRDIIIADTPFDDLDADIILRSLKSGVDFYVYKAFLSFASPFFKGMFSLPQNGVVQELKGGRPIIPVEEDSDILDILLKNCYPTWVADTAPALDTLERVIEVLQAATKYEMEGVEIRMRKEFVAHRFLNQEPVRVFALAVYHRLVEEAKTAAKETLRLPVLGRDYIPELELITAGVHHRLQEYHLKCATLACGVAKNLEWITNDTFVWFECMECRTRDNTSHLVTISGNRRKWVWSKWWTEYMLQADIALKDRPSGMTLTCPELVDEALAKASACSYCRVRAFKEFRDFTQLFAAQVDAVIENVILDIKLVA